MGCNSDVRTTCLQQTSLNVRQRQQRLLACRLRRFRDERAAVSIGRGDEARCHVVAEQAPRNVRRASSGGPPSTALVERRHRLQSRTMSLRLLQPRVNWRAPQSRKVYCEAFEIGKRAVSESTLVRGAQDHTRRLACLECFLPARGTEAPTVTWVQSWKAERGNWCRKIIAARFGKFEKRRSHNGTDRVTANVLSPGVAAAIPIKSCHGFDRADIKRLAEHVSGAAPPTASVTPIVPQHCRLSPFAMPQRHP